MKTYTVFTDGAAKGNGKKDCVGGIGVYFEGHPHLCYYEVITTKTFNTKVTNNLCELYAIKKAIELMAEEAGAGDFMLHLYTDSKYSYSIFTSWAKKWESNGWKKSDNKPIQNLDLIKSICNLKGTYKVVFHHCNSHTNPPAMSSPQYRIWYGNDMADKLANKGINEI